MKLLKNIDDILAIHDKEFEDVEVPEWDVIVRVAVMSGADRDSWELSMMTIDSSGKDTSLNTQGLSRANLLSRCIIDVDFNRLFVTDEQIKALSNKSAVVLDRLYEVAQRINKISDDDIEDLEKNSPAAQNGDSGSS